MNGKLSRKQNALCFCVFLENISKCLDGQSAVNKNEYTENAIKLQKNKKNTNDE